MAADRTASATWNGNLTEGSGQIQLLRQRCARRAPVTWAARSQESNGQTSPEELIAAAHASCFSMAFANMLFKKGFTAEQLDTTATVTFVPGTGITTSHLVMHGRVPGATEDEFLATAEEARAAAPSRRRSPASRSRSTRPSTRSIAAWPASRASSTSSSAPTRRRRSGCRIQPSTTTAAGGRRRPAPEGAEARKLAQAWREARADLDAARDDSELRELVPEYELRLTEVEEELKLALVERDPADSKDVIVEVRGRRRRRGVHLAGDVFDATRYAERRGFKWEQLGANPSEAGGFKEVTSP